ncbi:sulfonate/nitrate/taurine transport system substrate-binding protein [Sporothrix schenckii 1099-18]|uniref:Sulfonate/nitrate/taurine transport system substrate-binding protein n=1 Tax=Sporothrix schenckii 1099-18 TaxID=1397361 RepID=A0A0F2MCZ9_SPOSC|nr:sulfonate/nitrate/taurine transport system substrate-binding protein [Sporothrix schenckii 1099-18]KJR86730.1 sulfonate/nitrate/taurine transport system substrate-binding protein [Sporothrix schenckii 1099-18]
MHLPLVLAVVGAAASASATLKIASALSVIEYTPELWAIRQASSASSGGASSVGTITNGGVANIVSDTSIDLAANAETQALRQFATHKKLRIIYTVAEVAYRLVARSASATTVADLKGKRIGTIPGTSAAYFVERLLQDVGGLGPSDYTVVNGGICMAAPCGAGTLPYMLAHGTIDAAGMWEPTMQLVLDALSTAAVPHTVFQNGSVYSEVFNLHSTSDKLADPAKRKEIVAFLKLLDKAEAQFGAARGPSDAIVSLVASSVLGLAGNTSLVRAVWPVHTWTGDLHADKVLDVLVKEDAWVARIDRRTAMSRDTLSTLIDASVLAEARQG